MLRKNKVQVTLTVTPEEWEQLDHIASNRMKATGKAVTRTELIREAVQLLIERESREV